MLKFIHPNFKLEDKNLYILTNGVNSSCQVDLLVSSQLNDESIGFCFIIVQPQPQSPEKGSRFVQKCQFKIAAIPDTLMTIDTQMVEGLIGTAKEAQNQIRQSTT